MAFQELMRERFDEIIEHATGRPVIGFRSGNQQHPEMMCEAFIPAPTDPVREHEIPANAALAPWLTQHGASQATAPASWGGRCGRLAGGVNLTAKGIPVRSAHNCGAGIIT
jgi:hypothetical protein